jgi:protein-L-isoaspartate(D-aspartate) O-methyltransferase
MVQRLRQQPEMNAQVLAALAQVPRHRFLETALVNQAYADTSLPIGWGQTISKPSVVARMLSLLVQGRSVPLGRVLEIGSGCGYQAAVLAQLARHVVSVERVHGLYAMSKRHLDELGVRNVNAVYGDGMRGYGPSAPYDAIIAAAGGEAIPEAWLAQLAVGGRLVAPCRDARGVQSLVLIEHSITGFVRHGLEAVQFVPLKSGVVN